MGSQASCLPIIRTRSMGELMVHSPNTISSPMLGPSGMCSEENQAHYTQSR